MPTHQGAIYTPATAELSLPWGSAERNGLPIKGCKVPGQPILLPQTFLCLTLSASKASLMHFPSFELASSHCAIWTREGFVPDPWEVLIVCSRQTKHKKNPVRSGQGVYLVQHLIANNSLQEIHKQRMKARTHQCCSSPACDQVYCLWTWKFHFSNSQWTTNPSLILYTPTEKSKSPIAL